MSFKRVRFQEPEDNIEKSTSFLKLKKRRTTQRTLLPGHEQGKSPFLPDYDAWYGILTPFVQL